MGQYAFKNICRRAYRKYIWRLHGVWLLVNFIPDHATKHHHFIISNFRKTFHLFLEYGYNLIPALPILQITFKAIVYSISGFEWISFDLSKSASFSLQASENNLKPP